VCLNWSASPAIARVNCPDAPTSGQEIRVVELLTNEVSMRSPEDMRTAGLHVTIPEWAIQIFEY
jgi:hypothetical protein